MKPFSRYKKWKRNERDKKYDRTPSGKPVKYLPDSWVKSAFKASLKK